MELAGAMSIKTLALNASARSSTRAEEEWMKKRRRKRLWMLVKRTKRRGTLKRRRMMTRFLFASRLARKITSPLAKIRWIHDYQDACVDKLEKFISGEISSGGPSSITRASLSKGNSLNSCPLTPEIHGSSFRGDTQSSEGPPGLNGGGYLSADDNPKKL
eukprot:GHVO01035792.1.p1 GENE.GHVO01035792.1~~GHVO01035792.1.p1  ORF type:complete len:160 (+),score=31.77 GHVO01035792.1:86-565(+)